MNGFTLLWSKILDSSIWMEEKETRILWITMLAMKDANGEVRAARAALAHRARLSIEECEVALKVLMAPDPQSMTPDNEGRRIAEMPGGWKILNHEIYRFSTEAKREFWREQKAEQRRKEEEKKLERSRKRANSVAGDYESGQRRFVKAFENGDNKQCDEIAAEPAERLSGEHPA